MRRKNTKSHGLSNTRLYKIFHGMHKRCENPKSAGYQWYGERGIRVCEEWNLKDGFLNFYDWSIANGYKENLSIDRIDCNADYSPENCRWISQERQNNNKRSNCFYEYNGETHTVADWARLYNIKYTTLLMRLRTRGWDIEKALTREVTANGKIS